MLCMALGKSLTGFNYAQQKEGLHMQCEAACMNLTEAMSLSVTSKGRLGIKIPQRNLLVVERA